MNESNRRNFLAAALAGSIAAAGSTRTFGQPPSATGGTSAKLDELQSLQANWHGEEVIGMLIYPGFTALDLFGPHHMFISLAGAKVLLIAKDENPVASDSKVKIFPTTTFKDCPEKLTVLFVPGGTTGTLAAARDEATREFVADRGARADWVTSVCTGSIILGAAGLLKGYHATSHWLVRDELREFGAIPRDERVVVDRNRITGAGVTSGIDFGLQLAKNLRGDAYAKGVQLFSEYDPHPPFDCGSPKKSSPAVVTMLRTMHHQFNLDVRTLAESVRK